MSRQPDVQEPEPTFPVIRMEIPIVVSIFLSFFSFFCIVSPMRYYFQPRRVDTELWPATGNSYRRHVVSNRDQDAIEFWVWTFLMTAPSVD